MRFCIGDSILAPIKMLIYCRGLNGYQFHGPIFLLELLYRMPQTYLQMILVIISASRVVEGWLESPGSSVVGQGPSWMLGRLSKSA